jgi:hypothetical protein
MPRKGEGKGEANTLTRAREKTKETLPLSEGKKQKHYY